MYPVLVTICMAESDTKLMMYGVGLIVCYENEFQSKRLMVENNADRLDEECDVERRGSSFDLLLR